jgi:hypothetical protein
MDGLLTAFYPAARAKLEGKRAAPVLMAAVGGYGRQLLGLKSDLDIRFLTTEPERVRPLAEALLYPLWDCGVSIGHQIITLSDVLATAKRDLPTNLVTHSAMTPRCIPSNASTHGNHACFWGTGDGVVGRALRQRAHGAGWYWAAGTPLHPLRSGEPAGRQGEGGDREQGLVHGSLLGRMVRRRRRAGPKILTLQS